MWDDNIANIWDSGDMLIPLLEFMKLFNLTEKEIRREGLSARFTALYRSDVPDGMRASKIAIRESEARRWVLNRNLPSRVKAKVRLAGGLDALTRWREGYIDRIKFEEDAMVLPDGTRLTHIRFKEVSKH